MQFTVAFLGLLSLSSAWAGMAKKADESKDKREAPIGYGAAHSSQTLQIQPSLGHKDASAISIGAGYSVGGAKPTFSYESQPAPTFHLASAPAPHEQHATYQLAPITLQPDGGHLIGSDLSQIMSQISEGLNSGAISLQSLGGGYGAGGQQQQAIPQFVYGAPKIQQFSVAEPTHGGAPSYAAGTKGLGSYSTGPVLFNPESHSSQPQPNYAPSHSVGDVSHAFSSLSGSSGQTLGGPSFGGHSLGGHSLGGQSLGGHSLGGHSFGGHGLNAQSLGGHSFGGHSGLSLGGPGHSFAGAYKAFSSHAPPSKAFKPSAYLGSVGDSSHGSSGIAPTYGAPSFSHSLPAAHGGLSLGSGFGGLSLGPSGHAASFGGQATSFGGSLGGFGGGSTKFVSPSYLPPKSSDGFGSFESISAAFASNGHIPSPPSNTYGSASGSYSSSPSGSAHSAHAAHSSPQYYITPSKHTSSGSFGDGSSSYKAPSSTHSSLSSYNSGPKFSSSSHAPSSRYSSAASPKDSHGAFSESAYNTIKYSEELKPRPQA